MSGPNMTSDPDEGIGRRIARKRRARGLTQQGLANRAFVSLSLIQQVETGRKPATPSLVAAVATALRLEPSEIYGQPYRGNSASSDRVHASIVDIRRALVCVDIPPDLDTPPRPLDVIASEVTTLLKLSQTAQHVRLGARLPAALDRHGEAVEIAQRLPDRTPDFYGIQFNRGNVDIHGAAVAVELMDYDEAIHRDATITLPTTLTATRRAHHDIDIGRALVSTGQ